MMEERMKTPVKEIIEKVLALTGESSELLDAAIEYGGPDQDIRNLTETLIPETALEVLLSVPEHEVTAWTDLTEGIRRTEDRTLLVLPADCVRFLFLRMTDWNSPVSAVIPQGGDIIGLRRLWERSGPQHRGRPGLARTYSAEGPALEIFGTCAGSRIAEGGYLPYPVVDAEGYLRFPVTLAGRLASRLAMRIETIRERNLLQ